MQQKLALILTRARQSSNQFSGMTSIVGHKCGLRLVWFCICTKQCVLQPALFLEAQLGEHQPRVNKQHYVLLIILNKNVDTNMTLSSRWFMKNAMTAELSFILVCLRCTRLEEALVRPIIGGRTEKPVTRIYMTNEEGQHGETPTNES